MLTLEDTVATPAFHGGRSLEAVGADFSKLDEAQHVVNADVLDAWFQPSPQALRKILRYQPFLAKTSPPVYATGLVRAIARARGVAEEAILTGGGSSDLIFTCLPRWLESVCPRSVMILDPMYGEYRHLFEEVMGLGVARVLLGKEDDFRVDTDTFIERTHALQPDAIAIVNPNSPTGQHWPRREVLRFLDSLAPAIKVVIDETYIEYAGGRPESLETEAARRQNVMVIKSMSKVYALSGLRVAYLVAHPATVGQIAKWMPPWAVSLPAQVAGVEALADEAYYERRYAETHALRRELAKKLAALEGVRVYPSTASFLLIEIPQSAQRTLERMSEKNVFVRNCDSMGQRFRDRFLRIAVKRWRENERIVKALESALKGS